MLETGTIIEGRYEIQNLIGQGGMSAVYRAHDLVMGKDLAIKEANKQGKVDDRTAELSLGAEGKLLMRLSNVHLPKIYDIVETASNIMIVMDYIEGESLDKVLAKHGAIPVEKVIEWSIQICAVLQYLHTQNPPIIYRDMKPSNLILQPNGNIMLIDFGTARIWKVDTNQLSDTFLIGTEGFAAPEQFGGQGQSDARTDIFCLGTTMFNLVTNHSPYLKPYGVTPLSEWDPALEDCALERIIKKCTHRNPTERYQTALELKKDLIEISNNPGKIDGIIERIGKTKKNSSEGRSSFHNWNQKKREDFPREEISITDFQGSDSDKDFLRNTNSANQQKMLTNILKGIVSQTEKQADRGVSGNEALGTDMNIWLMLLIVCLSGGLVLTILGLIAMMSVPIVGIGIMVFAVLTLSGGIVCAKKYNSDRH